MKSWLNIFKISSKLFEITAHQSYKILFLILMAGLFFRAYDIAAPWKKNDHYNYGGVHTQVSVMCFNKLPLSVSRGLLIDDCEHPQNMKVYPNYLPPFIWGISAMTHFFHSEGEWVLRLWGLIWSVLNIGLVFLIARFAWPNFPFRWVLAAFFQTFFLSGLYFGTHVDPVSEFTTTFILLSVLSALKQRTHQAFFWAAIAGLTNWIGYFQFASLLIVHVIRRKHIALSFFYCIIGAVLCLGTMMYVKNTTDLLGFLHHKLLNPGYIPETGKWFDPLILPFRFIVNVFQSHARLLGPLFAGLAFYGFFRKLQSRFSIPKDSKPTETRDVFLLTLLPQVLFLIVGYRYAMIHVFNYNFAMPFWALLLAELCATNFKTTFDEEFTRNKKLITVLVLICVAAYPYGIFQSSRVHDVVNSVVLIFSALYFLWIFSKNRIQNISAVACCFVLLAAANVSQMMNYRNEPDTETVFCDNARIQFIKTGKTLYTNERQTIVKDHLYCKGIPIIYQERKTK